MRAWLCTALVVALGVLAAAAPAGAGTAEVRFIGNVTVPPEPKGGSPGGQISVFALFFTADAGEANKLTAATAGQTIRLTDAGAPITPGSGCHTEGADVVCTGTNAAPRFALGDGEDTFTSDTGGTVDAGEGGDKLTLSNTTSVNLGPGDDTVVGQFPQGTNPLSLGVDGGSGADSISATLPRSVSVTYANRTAGVNASIDGVADDGEPGEGDNLGAGVSAVTGGSGNDAISGGANTDDLKGGPGDDVVSGGGDKDFLNGGEGNDTLRGDDGDEVFGPEPGADTVRGGAGFDQMDYTRPDDKGAVTVTLDDQPGDGLAGENDDVGTDVEALRGGRGDDRLTGSDGPDVLSANAGNDFLDGRGGNDTLRGSLLELAEGRGANDLVGGMGVDAFKDVGLLDDVIAVDGEAETIECAERGVGPITGDPTDLGSRCLFGLDVPSGKTRLKVDRRGFARLPARCVDIGTTCTGTVALTAGDARTRRTAGRVLGRGRLTVGYDRPRAVRLKLSGRARRALARRGSLKVRARFATTRELPAESRTRSEPVKLLAPRR